MENKKNRIIQGLKKRTAVIGFALLLFLGGVVIFSDITKPYTFNDGDIISAGEMNENLDRLYAKVNELERLIIPGVIPIGTIMPFGGHTDRIPEGWLLCNGGAYSISEYSVLFNVIGSNFGYPSPGEFYVPDLRGMFLRGVDNGAGVDPDVGSRIALQSGGNIGDVIGSMQVDAFQVHQHSFLDGIWGNPQDVRQDGDADAANDVVHENYDETTGIISGNYSSETRPKNVYVNFIIKY